jgi:hypothetical protein
MGLAIFSNQGKVGLEFVLETVGAFILGQTSWNQSSPLLQKVMPLAHDMGLDNVVFESDCKLLADAPPKNHAPYRPDLSQACFK